MNKGEFVEALDDALGSSRAEAERAVGTFQFAAAEMISAAGALPAWLNAHRVVDRVPERQ